MLRIKTFSCFALILFLSVSSGYCWFLKKTEVRVSSSTTKKKSKIKVTFIELGSEKCIPCKRMRPIMKEIEEEYGDKGVKVIFYDVWTEADSPYAGKYAIQGVPTQVFLDRKGKEYFRHVGFFPKEELIKILQMKGIE